MSGKIRLKISPVVAAFVGPGKRGDEKLLGIEAAITMQPVDRVTLLFCLMKDADSLVAEAASVAFGALPEESLLAFLKTPDPHPSLLDAVARTHYSSATVLSALRECPSLSHAAGVFLENVVAATSLLDGSDAGEQEYVVETGEGTLSDAEEPEEPSPEEEYLSKYQMIQTMGVGEKIKMALTGDKEWRAILVNDNNKLVSGNVIKNPRITEGEILQILKVGVQNDEIIRLICANKEWVKNYAIRKALVDSPKTPLPLALRFLTSLNEKDIAAYAKSKNISSVISTQAKRIILAKKR